MGAELASEQREQARVGFAVRASQRLGLGADGYGALFGALGLGAIIGAFVLGRVRDRLSSNALLTAAGVLYAAALAVIVLTFSFVVALVTLVLAGVAWMAMTSTLAAELQLFLPVWVRARALAVFMLTFTGSMTVGALLWGLVAERLGLQPAFLTAAIVVLAGVVAGVFLRVPNTIRRSTRSGARLKSIQATLMPWRYGEDCIHSRVK